MSGYVENTYTQTVLKLSDLEPVFLESFFIIFNQATIFFSFLNVLYTHRVYFERRVILTTGNSIHLTGSRNKELDMIHYL